LWLTRCVKHLRPGSLDTLESAVSPGAGASGANSGNGVRAGDHLKSAGESEISGSVSRASNVTYPIFGHLPTQHPHTSLDTGGGGGYTDLLHLPPREARRRSTLSPTEGGAAEVFFNSGLVLKICGGGLKW
jgi:hypothetical protein